jgi:hypothetical protein
MTAIPHRSRNISSYIADKILCSLKGTGRKPFLRNVTEIALHPEDCRSNFLRFFYQIIWRHIPENEEAYFVIDAVRTAIIAIGCLFPDGFSAVWITVVQDVRHFTKFELAPCLCQAAPVHIVSFCRLSCLMVFPTTVHVLNTQAITLPTDTDIYIYI